MDWIIEITEGERRSGLMQPVNTQAAQNSLERHGCVILRAVHETSMIDRLRAEFDDQWPDNGEGVFAKQAALPAPNPVLKVGEKRYDILLRLKGAFADPYLLGNPLLCRFLVSSLEPKMRLSSATAVVSHPGSAMQHVHRDHGHLYPQSGTRTTLPPHAINVAIPLVDVDLATGPTGICLGSHRWPADRLPQPEEYTVVEFKRGDCILIDYRTMHAGMAHNSTARRPILYLVYARTWFFDENNHQVRPALDMAEEDFDALPPPLKPLLMRAFSDRARARYLLKA